MKNTQNTIDTQLLVNNATFQFVQVESMNHGFTDVYYNGERIAILNGISSPLQWTAKNGSNIPYDVIDELEKMVVELIGKTKGS